VLYVTDFAHSSVLAIQDSKEQENIVAVYEDKPLKGPNSIAIDKEGVILFTDSGPVGETGLHNPTGSIFMISVGPGGQTLKPIILEKLAYPSGIAISPNNKFM
jgi:sugar lactone lactonase YvrE